MNITVNGAPVELAEATTVAQLLADRLGQHRRAAVARNGEVVPRSEWSATVLSPGDTVEILVAVAGG
ncbi:MAG TPA: sulfur carrier protein ThiS [Micromonosporaceae bacterium]|nr:sulfur carrier protein ThiS [Micromonosporaceae bacterium]